MRSLFAFLGAALVAFLVLGWFLDWYKISSTPTDSGRRQVNFDLNIPKIGEDFKKGEQKAIQVIEKVSKKAPVASPDTPKAESKSEAGKPAASQHKSAEEEGIRILPPESSPGPK
jgi:hypothetical protein